MSLCARMDSPRAGPVRLTGSPPGSAMPVTRVGDGDVGDEASDAVELGPNCDPCPVGSTDEERGGELHSAKAGVQWLRRRADQPRLRHAIASAGLPAGSRTTCKRAPE